MLPREYHEDNSQPLKASQPTNVTISHTCRRESTAEISLIFIHVSPSEIVSYVIIVHLEKFRHMLSLGKPRHAYGGIQAVTVNFSTEAPAAYLAGKNGQTIGITMTDTIRQTMTRPVPALT